MKINTNDLSGYALDWAVSLITNPDWSNEDRAFNTFDYVDTGDPEDVAYSPSTNWSQGGEIVHHMGIALDPVRFNGCVVSWVAYRPTQEYGDYTGDTPLVAACKSFVASKLRNEVDVPQEAL